ncbi:RNA polymerase sigma-70 factor (ECF subfamily) [Actinoplanes lobatus]|uniref:RNA polymerase sigma-70 factor (ECF subfamily) n=1 Tax=Actinoplanes lobatus TaxID=113568 RepID=A0A7W7HMW4_9ACTN|nr:RNA polymerase sigma-70 factor (ECF subfamily) [Actinoplanes lobatus]
MTHAADRPVTDAHHPAAAVHSADRAVTDAHRGDWAVVLATTVRVTRDVEVAEECVQDAYAAALTAWRENGVPANPAAWLITASRRRALDVLRRERVLRTKLALLARPDEEAAEPEDPADAVPDERLRLIFMCCHPALAPEVRPALTLRLVCGLSTAEIAQAFLVSEPAMAARLTRAKKKITAARIPLRVPEPAELPERLGGVLGVIHLLFTTGHSAPAGRDLIRTDLTGPALHLARTLADLMPGEPEIRGLLALLLVTEARRDTRVGDDGKLVRLDRQDRSRWDRAAIAEADGLIVGALRARRPGRYVLEAAIAALHAQAPSFEETDWPQILTLYDALSRVWPSPVVTLNRAVALAEVHGPEPALAEVERLELGGRLSGYRYLPAVQADLLRRLGRNAEAAHAYRQALDLTGNETERAYLTERLAEAEPPDAEAVAGPPLGHSSCGTVRLTSRLR